MVKTKQQQPKEEEKTETKPNEHLKDFVAEQVLKLVGTPLNFSHVNAVNLFDDRWRINVYDKTPGFIEKRKIVASFYCITDKKGKVVSPEIKKMFS
jgi:hypothetical protein